MTNEEQLKWQKQCMLEDHFDKTDVKEQSDGKGTFVRVPHLVSSRKQDVQERVTKKMGI
jgi:hypothetical protein